MDLFTMDKDKTLLDLPVYPEDRDMACVTDTIFSTYIEERNKISSAQELVVFVKRWRNLFLLKDLEPLTGEECAIVTRLFDYERVYDAFINRNAEGLDLEDLNVKIMVNICVPYSLLKAHALAKKYGVGSDLAMVRLYLDPFEELEDKLR